MDTKKPDGFKFMPKQFYSHKNERCKSRQKRIYLQSMKKLYEIEPVDASKTAEEPHC